MGTKEDEDRAATHAMASVEFTLVAGADMDRFDYLLSEFADDSLSQDELDEFGNMVIDARRLDGKD